MARQRATVPKRTRPGSAPASFEALRNALRPFAAERDGDPIRLPKKPGALGGRQRQEAPGAQNPGHQQEIDGSPSASHDRLPK